MTGPDMSAMLWCNESGPVTETFLCQNNFPENYWSESQMQTSAVPGFVLILVGHTITAIPFCASSRKKSRIVYLRGKFRSTLLASIAVLMGYYGISSIASVNLNVVLEATNACTWWSFGMQGIILLFCHFATAYINGFYLLYHKNRALDNVLQIVSSRMKSNQTTGSPYPQSSLVNGKVDLGQVIPEEEDVVTRESEEGEDDAPNPAELHVDATGSPQNKLQHDSSSVPKTLQTRATRRRLSSQLSVGDKLGIAQLKLETRRVPHLKDKVRRIIIRMYQKFELRLRILAFSGMLIKYMTIYSALVSLPLSLIPHQLWYTYIGMGYIQQVVQSQTGEIVAQGVAFCVFDESYLVSILSTCILCSPYVGLCAIMGVSIYITLQQVGNDIYGIRKSLTRMGISMFLALMFYGVTCIISLYTPTTRDYLAGCVAFMGEYMYAELVVIPKLISNKTFRKFLFRGKVNIDEILLWRTQLPKVDTNLVLEEFLVRSDENMQAMMNHLKTEMNCEILVFWLEVQDFEAQFGHMASEIEYWSQNQHRRKSNQRGHSFRSTSIISEINPDTPTGKDSTTQEFNFLEDTSYQRIASSVQTFQLIQDAERALHEVKSGKQESMRQLTTVGSSGMFRDDVDGHSYEDFREQLCAMIDEAEEIAAKFLRAGSPFQVNLPSHLYRNFEVSDSKPAKQNSYQFRQDPKCFQAAKKEILSHLVFDSLPRFLAASPAYQMLWSTHIRFMKEELHFEQEGP